MGTGGRNEADVSIRIGRAVRPRNIMIPGDDQDVLCADVADQWLDHICELVETKLLAPVRQVTAYDHRGNVAIPADRQL